MEHSSAPFADPHLLGHDFAAFGLGAVSFDYVPKLPPSRGPSLGLIPPTVFQVIQSMACSLHLNRLCAVWSAFLVSLTDFGNRPSQTDRDPLNLTG